MLSIVFLAFAVVHLVLLWRVVGLWRRTRSGAVMLVLLPMLFIWYDCFMIGVGRWVGLGELLYAANLPRYWAHWLLTPTWVMAAGALARRAGLEWARPRWAMGSFCVLGAVLIAQDVPHFFTHKMYPACYLDTVQYGVSVTELSRCSADQPLVAGGGPPLAPIVTILVLLVVGGFVWKRTGWRWMCLGSVAMLVLAGVPMGRVGPVFGNLGEIILAFALVRTAEGFSPEAPRAEWPRAAAHGARSR